MALDAKQTLLVRMAIYLSVYKDFIGIQNNSKHFDINRLSENVIADLLTHVGGWGVMEVLDRDRANHIAIDLRSEDGTVGVQVTSDKSGEKVADTLTKFNKLSPRPKHLYVVMLRGRQTDYKSEKVVDAISASKIAFDPLIHILEMDDLHAMAKERDADCIERANRCMEDALGSWAVGLLSRHRSSAGKLLQVCAEHGLTPQQILEFLGVARPYSLAAAHDVGFVSSVLTADTLQLAADEFRVPLEWLTSDDAPLGQSSNYCPWRGAAGFAELLTKILQRTPGEPICLKVVTPAREHIEDGHILELEGDQNIAHAGSQYPILVFSETQGQYGRAYEHFGIQPGEIEHYRKSACFLIAYLRMRAFNPKTNFRISCSWEQWPRAEIFATTRTRLLAATRNVIEFSHDQDAHQYASFIDGGAYFPNHPDWDEEFNKEYVSTMDRSLINLEHEIERDLLDDDLEQYMALFMGLPPGSERSTRIYGHQAIALAAKCNVMVNLSMPSDVSPGEYLPPRPIFADEAQLLTSEMDWSSAQNKNMKRHLHLMPVFYVDVVPE